MRAKLLLTIALLSLFLLAGGCIPIKSEQSTTATSPLETSTLKHDQYPETAPRALPEIEEIVQEIIYYQKHITAASEQNLLRELRGAALYDLDKIGPLEQIHIILLSMHPKVSINDLPLLKRVLDAPYVGSQDLRQTREFVEFLYNIAKKQTALRLRAGMLNKELAASMKQNIILDQTVMEHQKRAENLQKQIQGLKDIEKIIIQRDKPD